MERRPDCRRYVCDGRQRTVYICSWCDRGHRYCSTRCRETARRQTSLLSGLVAPPPHTQRLFPTRLDYVKAGDERVRLRANKTKEGEGKVGSTVPLTVLFGPLGFVDQDVDLIVPD